MPEIPLDRGRDVAEQAARDRGWHLPIEERVARFREFPAAAMCSVHGDPVTTTAHDTEADALAEADRQRGLRRVAVVWCVGEVEA